MTEGSERSLHMLAAALEKEEKGRELYHDAAARCSNDLAKEMFRILMSEEGIHINRIKEIYSTLARKESWSTQWKEHRQENMDLQKLLQERAAAMRSCAKANTSEIQAVDLGIGMEQGSITFYNDQMTKAVDLVEREFLKQMIAEEQAHLRSLEDLKLFLTDPEAWYIEKERHGLDG